LCLRVAAAGQPGQPRIRWRHAAGVNSACTVLFSDYRGPGFKALQRLSKRRTWPLLSAPLVRHSKADEALMECPASFGLQLHLVLAPTIIMPFNTALLKWRMSLTTGICDPGRDAG